MIDTDEYEGHTEGTWHFCLGYDIKSDTYTGINSLKGGGDRVNGPVILSEYQFAKGSTGHRADMALIEDAPLLLEEVKRLRAYKEFADGVDEWSSGAAFIHHLATAVQGIRQTGELDEDAFNKGCQEYYNGKNSSAQVSTIQWNDLKEEVKRLRKQLKDCKQQIQSTADWIRDRGEPLMAKDLDNFLEWMK